jgi:hypothetical protein
VTKEDMMHLGARDRLATLFVALASLSYLGWALLVEDPDETGVRVIAAVVLMLGFAASASAVVPGFGELLHGSKVYLALTSLIGLGALIAGIAALVDASESMLGVLVATTLTLWAISTVRHATAPGPATRGDARPAAPGTA